MANFEEAARKRELAAKYAAVISQRENEVRESLTKGQYEFIKNSYSEESAKISDGLTLAMREKDVSPSEYLSKHMSWLFDKAISPENRKVVLYYADRLRDYPYSVSYERRSFRSNSFGAYAPKLEVLIRQHASGILIDEPLHMILNRELSEEAMAYVDTTFGRGYSEWQIAYALEHNDTKTEEAVRRIITEENGSGAITVQLIRGVLLSRRTDLHELIGKLLLAARLQEGLRQAICENADQGTKSAFLTLLKVIGENGLIRFSSVKRAVGTWLGIVSDDSRSLERISDKSIKLISDCLESESLREEYLASEDAMKIHIALWSYGLDDIGDSVRKIAEIAKNGSVHALLVSGYFAANLDIPHVSNKLAREVITRHSDKTDVLAVWLPCYLPHRTHTVWRFKTNGTPAEYGIWFDSKAELEENYNLIKKLYTDFDGKTKTFSPCVFPWYEAKISKSDLAQILCILAALLDEDEIIDETCGALKDCSADHRSECFFLLLGTPRTAIQRKAVIDALSDRETYTRKNAYEIASKLSLTEKEYRSVEDLLRFKGGDIRGYAISLLLKQGDAELTESLSRLLANSKEDIRFGALDILLQLKNDEKRRCVADSFNTHLTELSESESLTVKEKALLGKLLPKGEEKQAKTEETKLYTEADVYSPSEFDAEYTELCAKAFSEFFPDSVVPDAIRGKKQKNRIAEKIKIAVMGNSPCGAALTAEADILSLSKFIEEHKTATFKTEWGAELLLGNIQSLHQLQRKDGIMPFEALWNEWRETNGITDVRLFRMVIKLLAYKQKDGFGEACAPTVKSIFGEGFEYCKPIPYQTVIAAVLRSLITKMPQKTLTMLAAAFSLWFIKCLPDDKVIIKEPMQIGNTVLRNNHILIHSQLLTLSNLLICRNDESLKNVFPIAVAKAEKGLRISKNTPEETNVMGYTNRVTSLIWVGTRSYLYAASRGIITEAQLFKYILSPEIIQDAVQTVSAVTSCYYEKDRQISTHLSYSGKMNLQRLNSLLDGRDTPTEEDIKLLDFTARIYEKLIPVILSSELSRGDVPTEYTKGARGIARIYGVKYLADILSAMGNDTLDRSAYYGYSADYSRRSSLSFLLSVCIPRDTDTAETLRAALEGKNISQKRLIEAALYSPEWIPLIGRYLGIDAFESVCYYFMAHMNERFDDKRRATIARFTPLSEEELNLGAFDVSWFRSAYASVDEKTFEAVYDAAKYISDGAKHARARKYADAALGKMTVAETEKAISDKRNKDLLMAYSLIPIENDDELCRRYLFIQKFRKESKQFGSQRIASEGKASEMALTNLALNAGYSDTMRLTLRMETKAMENVRALLEKQTVEDVTLKITLDENGKAALTAAKDGKPLKSVPARLKKQETVAVLSETVKLLTEQYRRTRVMLEQAMEDCTAFTFAELSALSTHPVVYPMLKNLVLISGSATGFLSDGGITDFNGGKHTPEDGAEVRIAHPFHLYKAGCWRDYQKYLYENKITQPFRQVFRELYIKTEEEKEALHSLRYAGNQIQPAKTVSVLKSRRWVADIEDGLQKVYYKENIVARIFALADWFTPADIEAPTLEWVCFSDRRTGEEIKISNVPDVIFSEVMRDVDLAVSVAHAGGVDPETSHSTVEMRAAILSFVLPMFRITNVRVEGRHAIINGALAEYSVHLGSGIVHQIGGSMIPVLPVHSQHRGKIFLPFVDDDPKTAEIVSKVLLFAEDSRIKDPMILSAISK